MSDYRHALESRKESLEAAALELDEARADSFTDAHIETEIDGARESVQSALKHTKAELEVLNRDWKMVCNHAETILDELCDVAEKLDSAGLVDFNEMDYVLRSTLDDEPEELRDARQYIDRALDDWHEVRIAAEDAKQDAQTGGRY